MHRTRGRSKRTISNGGPIKSPSPKRSPPRPRGNSSDNMSTNHQCAMGTIPIVDEPSNSRDRHHRLTLRALSAFLSLSGLTDLIFLAFVCLGIWRMSSTTILRHRQYHGTIRDATSRIRQLETLEPLKSKSRESGGSATFQSTHACAAGEESTTPLCEIHFPLNIEDKPSQVDRCHPEFCLRQLHRLRPNNLQRDHGALLRPLVFDGKQTEGTNKKQRILAKNSTMPSAQLLVLADGLSGTDEQGHQVSEIVSRHLPLFLLEAFHRYAKPFSKIHKIISHAFEAMDRSLYEQQRELWKNAGATALVMMQHDKRLFLASAGTNVGFLARYDSETGQATIVKRVQPHTPDTSGENTRISKLGGIVGKQPPVSTNENSMLLYPSGSDTKEATNGEDSDNDGFRVFLAGDSRDEGIMTARVIGGGRWKYRGVVSVPAIEEVDLSSLWYKDAPEKNQFFLVAASDGLLKQKPKDPNGLVEAEGNLANRLGQALYGTSDEGGVRLEREISAILREDQQKNMRDDRTLMVTTIVLDNDKW